MLFKRATSTVLALVLAASGAQLAFAEGSIKGTVKWDGKAPKRKKAKLAADPYCQNVHGDTPLLLAAPVVVGENGGLQYVFVQVKSGLPAGKSWPVPAEPVVLDQKGCSYAPHVFGVMPGQTLQIKNSDDTSHNVNCSPKNNDGFNQGQPKKGMVLEKSFKNAEQAVPFKCDVHPWMSAWCFVMEHPFFAVSNENGEFEMTGLPPGEYVIEAWHEHPRIDAQQTTVVVQDGESAAAEFTFSRPTKGKMSAGGLEVIRSTSPQAVAKPSCCSKTK